MISILVSKSNDTFCDGSRMDSDGYRQTLTQEVPFRIPPSDGTLAGKAKALAIALQTSCSHALRYVDFTVRDGIVTIAPVPGWAGISIAMCTCKPEIDVNLLRLRGITKVVWDGE